MDNNNLPKIKFLINKVRTLHDEISACTINDNVYKLGIKYRDAMELLIKLITDYPEFNRDFNREYVKNLLRLLEEIWAICAVHQALPINPVELVDFKSLINVTDGLIDDYVISQTNKKDFLREYNLYKEKISVYEKRLHLKTGFASIDFANNEELFARLAIISIPKYEYDENEENLFSSLIDQGNQVSLIFCQIIVNCYKDKIYDKDKHSPIHNIKRFVPPFIYKAVKFNNDLKNAFCFEDIKFNKQTFDAYVKNMNLLTNYISSFYDNYKFGNLLDELIKDDDTEDANKDEEIKKLKEEIELKNKELVKKEEEANQILPMLNKIYELNVDTNKKVNQILDVVTSLNDSIHNYKEFIKDDIQENEDEDVISDFQNKVVAKINSDIENSINFSVYKRYENELEAILNTDNFNKLTDESKNFIITAKIMYENLSNIGEDVDYSGVCLLLTKALEKECKYRFFEGYVNYMHNRYGDDPSYYPLWCTNLKRNHQEEILPSKMFTLGTIPYALHAFSDRNDTSELWKTMIDYCQDVLFINTNYNHIKDALYHIGMSVDEVTKKYRNPAAHIESMSKIKATECFNYLLEIRKLIEKILNEVKY